MSIMKFLRYQSRNIVVLDGRPYYQSTGLNSGMKGAWLPFYGCASHTKPVMLTKLVDVTQLTRDYQIIGINGQTHGALIKYNCGFAKAAIPATWCILSVKLKQRDEKTQCSQQEARLFQRLFLKIDLINSARLTQATAFGLDAKAMCTQAGLSATEIQASQSTVTLDAKAELEATEPEQVNAWLIQQGVMLDYYPDTYLQLWEKAGEPILFSLAVKELVQAKALLEDFVELASKPAMFKEAKADTHKGVVSAALADKKLDSPNEIVSSIRKNIPDLDPKSTLAARLDFIERMTLNTQEKLRQAIALAETKEEAECTKHLEFCKRFL